MGGLGRHISQRDREYFRQHGEWYPGQYSSKKKERLAAAITKFKDSKQTKQDYMDLFTAVHSALRQGSGLIWSQVDEVLEDVLNK